MRIDMQNSLLSPSYIANLGCATGNDSGFSGCEIWTQPEGLHIRWCQIGDRRWSSEALHFLAPEWVWAFAYNEEIDFHGSVRELEVLYSDAMAVRLGTVNDLRHRFRESLALLEIEYEI